jgi:hypothetical protein
LLKFLVEKTEILNDFANTKFHDFLVSDVPPLVEDIKIRRLGWAGHMIRMEEERIPKKGFKWNLPQHKTSGKTKNQMGRCGSEGCITAARSKRVEEKS